MEDAYENLQQVGGNELALFAEEGVEHCYDLGQEVDRVRDTLRNNGSDEDYM